MVRTAGLTVSRAAKLAFVILALLLAIAPLACGGDDDDDGGGSGLRIDGAEELDSADVSDDEMDELGFEASDGEGFVYRTDASVEEVTAYYTEGIEDEGWTVEESVPVETQAAVVSNDDTLAFVLWMAGSDAAMAESLVGEELDIDLDEIDDDDTLIIITRLTCEEDNVAACISGLLAP